MSDPSGLEGSTDLDDLFNMAEEDMNQEPDEDDGAADGDILPDEGIINVDNWDEPEQEPEIEIDDDVLAMLDGIGGDWHEKDGDGFDDEPKGVMSPTGARPANVGVNPLAQGGGVEAGLAPAEAGYRAAMTELAAKYDGGVHRLVAFLLRPGNEGVQVLEQVVPSSSYNQLADALVELCLPLGQCPELLVSLLGKQIAETPSEDVLMRHESLGIRTMRSYFNRTAGEYMRGIMTPLMNGLLTTELQIEIEPEDDEIPEGVSREDYKNESATNLAALCATILDAVEAAERSDASPQRTPWELRYVMWGAYEATKKRFPGAEASAAAALLFLRLITPTVTMGGKNFKLDLDQKLVMSRRRVTTLVGKIVQYVANGVIPDGFPQPILDFIQTRIATNQELMHHMAGRCPSDADSRYITTMPAAEYEHAVQPLVDYCLAHQGVLTAEALESPEEMELASAVMEAVQGATEASIPTNRSRDDRSAHDDPGYGACCVIC